jgi:hypothetical protein
LGERFFLVGEDGVGQTREFDIQPAWWFPHVHPQPTLMSFGVVCGAATNSLTLWTLKHSYGLISNRYPQLYKTPGRKCARHPQHFLKNADYVQELRSGKDLQINVGGVPSASGNFVRND